MHVLVRPRGGGFVYDADEFATMSATSASPGRSAPHGVVVGALTEDGRLDLASVA